MIQNFGKLQKNVKFFLSKSQKYFEIEQRIVILKVDSKFYRLDSS